MSYEVIIYGDLTLDSRAVGTWKKTKLDATDLAKGDLGMSKEIVFIHDEKATVETVLPRLPNDPVEFVRVEARGGRVVVRGFINEDLHRDIGPEIAALAVAVGAAGGRGELFFTSPEEDFLVTVSVDGARVKATTVYAHKNPSGAKAVAAARNSDGYRDVIAAVDAGLTAARGSRPPRPAPRALDEAGTALHRACIARLGRVSEMSRTAAELAEASAPNASAALRRLATIDPDSAETIAIGFCALRPVDDLAEGIAFGLAARSSDASLDATCALLAELDVATVKYALSVRAALATSRNADAGARAFDLLETHAKNLAKPLLEAPGVEALVFAVGQHRHKKASALLKTLAKHEALRRSAMIAIQTISKGSRATGFRVGPRGGLIARKTKPKAKKRAS